MLFYLGYIIGFHVEICFFLSSRIIIKVVDFILGGCKCTLSSDLARFKETVFFLFFSPLKIRLLAEVELWGIFTFFFFSLFYFSIICFIFYCISFFHFLFKLH